MKQGDNRKLIKQEGARKELCNSLMRNNNDEEIKATSSGKKSINKKVSQKDLIISLHLMKMNQNRKLKMPYV